MIDFLFRPASIASLVYIRICFGLIIFIDCLRYIGLGWVEKNFIRPGFRFSYAGFDWLPRLSEGPTYLLWGVTGLTALFVAFGFFYRLSSIVLFLGFSFIFLSEKAMYLNHFYFVVLMCFSFIFLSPHKYLSIDVRLNPSIRETWVPNWQPSLITVSYTHLTLPTTPYV